MSASAMPSRVSDPPSDDLIIARQHEDAAGHVHEVLHDLHHAIPLSGGCGRGRPLMKMMARPFPFGPPVSSFMRLAKSALMAAISGHIVPSIDISSLESVFPFRWLSEAAFDRLGPGFDYVVRLRGWRCGKFSYNSCLWRFCGIFRKDHRRIKSKRRSDSLPTAPVSPCLKVEDEQVLLWPAQRR